MKAQVVQLDGVTPFSLGPGVIGKPLFGDDLMFNLVECEPGSVVPLHSHPHEQLGIILSGMLTLEIDGVPHELGPMQAVALPSGIEHAAVAGPEGAVMLDVFTPVREDFRAKSSADDA